jgi:Ca2+-binding RTX toxin-like protein
MATINGTSSNDTLSGTSGDDTLNGFGGNDLFLAGSTGGNDVINGGAGRDSIEFKTRATSAIVVDFVAGTITGGSSGTISFTSIERILTGDFNDTLIGNAAGQTLTGQGGSDTLSGAGGVDTLWGGTAADSFVFRETGTANADRISDFASGSDKIVLDATVMSALGANGNFAAGDMRFVANSTGTAQDASDRIIYETDTRQVWYDADGNGTAAARQLLATLQTGATLAATDIVVEGGSSGMHVVGTSGNDTLVGGDGNDTLEGLAGDDALFGGRATMYWTVERASIPSMAAPEMTPTTSPAGTPTRLRFLSTPVASTPSSYWTGCGTLTFARVLKTSRS